MIRWKYPFHPSAGTLVDHQDAAMESGDQMDDRREKVEESQRPVAKPRVKVVCFNIAQHTNLSCENVILKILFSLSLSSPPQTQLFERHEKIVQKETKSEVSMF